jgi:hypothetical protein
VSASSQSKGKRNSETMSLQCSPRRKEKASEAEEPPKLDTEKAQTIISETMFQHCDAFTPPRQFWQKPNQSYGCLHAVCAMLHDISASLYTFQTLPLHVLSF